MARGLLVWLLYIVVLAVVSSEGEGEGTRGSGTTPGPVEPCPMGCRCMKPVSFHHGRYRWHHLLAAYRMRRLVYGHNRASSSLQSLVQKSSKEDTGREMTCLGLPNVPEYVPADVSKVTFYGQAQGNDFQKDDAVGDATSGSSAAVGRLDDVDKKYNQLTSLDIFAFHRSSSLKDLFIEGNRIKVVHANDFEGLHHLRRLRMRNNRLQLIWSDAFKGLDNLEEIDLAKNHLKRLPKTLFDDVPNLKKLFLNDNRIRGLSEKMFTDLTHLEKLDLSHNYLKDIPKNLFYGNSKVKELAMDGNHISLLRPEWFAPLRKLTKLSFRGNRITEISSVTWPSIPNLQRLDLGENEISYLSQHSFENLDSLQVLALDKNNISTINDRSFSNLEVLEKLHLDENEIDELTNETFHGLENLVDLGLSGNKLLEVPHEAVKSLTKMESLDLANNEIKIIRYRNFFGLGELRELRLEHNRIKVVEEEAFAVGVVNNFSKLTWLYLNHNRVGTVTSNMLYGLAYLKFLNIGHNSISNLEEGSLSMLHRLHTLIINNNSLKSLGTASFKHLKHLQHLNLAYNEIRQLELNAFLGLERTEDINLQANVIEDVTTQAFLDTPRLTSLNLKKNKLRHIDFSMMEVLERLRYVDLSRNSISRISLPGFYQRDLYFLSLADNDLQQLPEEISKVMSTGGSIHLYGNPWSCDCNLKWLTQLPQERRVVLVDGEDIVCKTPRSLSGEKVMSLKAGDFRCETNEAKSPLGLLADQPVDRVTRSCDVMDHAADEITRDQVKAQKQDVFDWFTSFYDVEGKYFCKGIRMERDWILTPSHCWKPFKEGDYANVQFGPTDANSSATPVEIRVIKHFTGSLDLALVKTSRVREDDQTRFFPCLLSKDGVRSALKARLHGVLLARAAYIKSESKVKVRGFPFRLRRLDRCPNDSLCIQDQQNVIPESRYDLLDSAFFVKVGRSKWALAGFTSQEPDSDNTYTISLVNQALRWMDRTLY